MQFARPTEDAFLRQPEPQGTVEEQDSWRSQLGGTTDVYQWIRQFIPNDSDYAESNLMRGPTLPDSSDAYVAKLTEVTDPYLVGGLTVKARLAKDVDDGNSISCLVELRKEYNTEGEGEEADGDLGILLASETFEDISSTFAEYSFAVSEAAAEGIEDFADLYLRFVFTAEEA